MLHSGNTIHCACISWCGSSKGGPGVGGKQRHSGFQRYRKASHAKQKWAEAPFSCMFSLCAVVSPNSKPRKRSSVSWFRYFLGWIFIFQSFLYMSPRSKILICIFTISSRFTYILTSAYRPSLEHLSWKGGMISMRVSSTHHFEGTFYYTWGRGYDKTLCNLLF